MFRPLSDSCRSVAVVLVVPVCIVCTAVAAAVVVVVPACVVCTAVAVVALSVIFKCY